MKGTWQQGGRLRVGYVDDGQGRRMLLGEDDRGAVRPIVAATTREEAKALAGAILSLAEELPPGAAS